MLFLLSVIRPSGFDPSASVTPEMRQNIDALNEEMVTAGVRRFVGGLQPVSRATTFEPGTDGAQPSANVVSDHVLDGLWVIEVDSDAEAQGWAKKASMACRAKIEARPFH